MNNLLKVNISKFEKNTLSFCLILTILSCIIITLKPISPDIFQNITYLFETILMFLLTYIILRTVIIIFIKLSLAIWGKSWVWEYRKKFVIFVVNSAMYIATLFSLIFIIKGFIQLDPQLIIYSCGFLGALVGGYYGKRRYIEQSDV